MAAMNPAPHVDQPDFIKSTIDYLPRLAKLDELHHASPLDLPAYQREVDQLVRDLVRRNIFCLLNLSFI